jgi:hypothetical protein
MSKGLERYKVILRFLLSEGSTQYLVASTQSADSDVPLVAESESPRERSSKIL